MSLSDQGLSGVSDTDIELSDIKDELEAALVVLVQVARGEKGRAEVGEWLLQRHPELLPI